MAYLFLALAIISEVIGAVASRYSDGFRKIIQSVIVTAAIIASYYFFAISLQYGMNIGVGYAIWAGVSVILVVVIIGKIFFEEYLTKIQAIGVVLIIGGGAALELGAQI
ncbi:multidrug efflux SMR transporter [Thalassobacillus sp. CUG 92003]|uniref:DMT family transporter n=1 Tax=Thalassobacillus sp. CUG 92003 TaxID=2736641 RepID=UPI0015E7076C|nr:SMR family transporter [Thalassobacillus sp. CUG 92003]